MSSPNKLQGKLHLAGRGGRLIDSAGVDDVHRRIRGDDTNPRYGWIDYKVLAVVDRRVEVRMVKDVECFDAELNVEVLRNSLHRRILHQRKVQIPKIRPFQFVAAGIPVWYEVRWLPRHRIIGYNGGRRHETLGLDIVLDIIWIDKS